MSLVPPPRSPFTGDEVAQLRRGAVTVSLLAPAQNRPLVAALADRGVTALALDCIPRTLSRAQAFDVLSSQANIAGYRAVVRLRGEWAYCRRQPRPQGCRPAGSVENVAIPL